MLKQRVIDTEISLLVITDYITSELVIVVTHMYLLHILTHTLCIHEFCCHLLIGGCIFWSSLLGLHSILLYYWSSTLFAMLVNNVPRTYSNVPRTYIEQIWIFIIVTVVLVV